MNRFLTRSALSIILTFSAAETAVAANLSEQLSKSISGAQAEAARRAGQEATELMTDDPAELQERNKQRRALLLKRASAYELVNDFDSAESELTTALRLEPVDPQSYSDRAYFYMRRHRFPDALSDFISAARLQPENSRFQFGAGRVQAAMQNYTAAIKFYDEAIDLNPKDSIAMLARAEARIRLNLFQEAITDYDQAISIGIERPNDRFFAFLGRGYVKMRSEDFAGAVADFSSALKIEQKSTDAMMWRGYANEKLGRKDLAMIDYEKALSYNPSLVFIRQSLIRLRSLVKIDG